MSGKGKRHRLSPRRLKPTKRKQGRNTKRSMNTSFHEEERHKQWKEDINKICNATAKQNQPSSTTDLKAEKIRNLAEMIENKAQQKEQVLNAKEGLNVEETIEVNDMYISAIKAKLALLDTDD